MDGLLTTGLKSLPSDTRPREKLLARGPGALSDAELLALLLALLLRTGIPGKHVVQLARELLDPFGGVGGLLHTGAEALKVIKGLGLARRAEVVAVLELARRALAQELKLKPLFDSPKAVRDYLQLRLCARAHEVFAVMFLDSQNRLIELEELFRGTLTQTSVYPREVVLRALPPRCGRGACAQPPQRHGPAVSGRRSADADPQCGAVAGGRAGAGPLHRDP